MYVGFHKLTEMPFRLAPDPRFMYWSAGHSAALACIRSAQKHRDGRVILIGDRGAGKTALLEYVRQLAPANTTRRIDFPPRTSAELTQWIHESLEGADAVGGRVILCDNAHLFHETLLAALLRAAPACVVLAGEPALTNTLQKPELSWLGQSRCEQFHLPPLTSTEVQAYVELRLKVAGNNGARLFAGEICAQIHRETKGSPRLINVLCDAALSIACERELHEVGSGEVRRALEDVGRLVALQAEERAAPVPETPPEDHLAASEHMALARLELTHDEKLVLARDLATGSLRIGRNTDNELCIESRFVSRHHCRIVTTERRCILEDVHSTNGLFVNNKRVLRHQMQDGDVVQIGEHRLRYLDLRQRAGEN